MRLTPRRAVLAGLIVVLLALLSYPAMVVVRARRITASLLTTAHRFEREGLAWSQVPPAWREILIQVEDPGFYDHNGVDLSTPGAGMTTITQGLVKIHYFEKFRPGLERKLRQSIMALVLDRSMLKDLQLTLLLNTAYFGTRDGRAVQGFPEAAKVYFGKPFQRLERSEYLSLVAMLVGPDRLQPGRDRERLAERVRRIDRLVAGQCHPQGWDDVWLDGCR